MLTRERRPDFKQVDRWAIGVLQEAGAIHECDQQGWAKDRTDPHARTEALRSKRGRRLHQWSDSACRRWSSGEMEKNRPKILEAPLTVIIGNDLDFADALPKLMPHNAEAMQKAFAAPDLSKMTAMAVCRARISSSRRVRWGSIAGRCLVSITLASTEPFLPARASSRTSSVASVTESRTRYFRAIRGLPSRKQGISLKNGNLTMPTSDIEKALTVFRGIASRDPELTTKYMKPGKYIQHNPHAADGVEGLKEYVSQFPRENHHLKVVRAFQDGPYVFTQEEGLILGQSVFFDIFRFEDGLIVEHWVFSTKAAPPNESRPGHRTVADVFRGRPLEAGREGNKVRLESVSLMVDRAPERKAGNGAVTTATDTDVASTLSP